MTGVLSPLPRSLHQQQASAGNTCGPTVEGSSFLKPSEWPQALTHRQATWPAVSTGTLGLAALLSVRLAVFSSVCYGSEAAPYPCVSSEPKSRALP